MRATPLLALFSLGCPRGPGDGNTVTGVLGGEPFDPATVVFDEYSAGPDDSATSEQQLMLVLADAPEACPLLGPLFHYAWLRCESACSGLLEHQDSWPGAELRVVWVSLVVDQDVEAAYVLASSDGPGLFTATYRSVDLDRLADMDQDGCFAACTEDYNFLLGDQGSASVGDFEVDRYSPDLLEGELDLLFSQGDVKARFEASVCAMGLHGP